MSDLTDEADAALTDVLAYVCRTRHWINRGNANEAKVAARHAAQALDRVERLLAEAVEEIPA